MPVSGDHADFKRTQRRNFNPDEDDCDQHDHDGHNRVHGDAQRAMVGIAIGRMDVRYLNDGKQREQDQAQNGRHLQSVWL